MILTFFAINWKSFRSLMPNISTREKILEEVKRLKDCFTFIQASILIVQIRFSFQPFMVPMRVLMLLGGGLLAVFGSEAIELGGAGPLAVVAAAFISCYFWQKQGWEVDDVSIYIYKIRICNEKLFSLFCYKFISYFDVFEGNKFYGIRLIFELRSNRNETSSKLEAYRSLH